MRHCLALIIKNLLKYIWMKYTILRWLYTLWEIVERKLRNLAGWHVRSVAIMRLEVITGSYL
jgi:hypothetical protein